MKKNKFITFFAPSIIVLLIIFGIVLFPTESIDAAKSGFSIWANTLIPSLLPFIIAANLIVSLKFVDVIGLIINPITRKLFNVSGKSALVFAISTVSGYPIG
ncbi:MAG: sporulation integral membrane protein YlbJ, partial [Paraclostridium sp.]